MTPFNFPEQLAERIEFEIREESGRLAKGMAADWADYKTRVGIILGLEKLKTIIDELTEDRK